MRWWVSLVILLTLTAAVPPQNTMVTVPNNTALRQLSVAAAKTVLRAGFAAPGDGGAMVYTASTAACTAADNGAQVATTVGTGCWHADFSVTSATPMVWGAKGDGAVDDTAVLQAAINALQGQGNILWLGNFCYGLRSTLVITGMLTVQGNGKGNRSLPDVCTSGFRALVPNITQITVAYTATGTTLRDFHMTTAATARPNISGATLINRAPDTTVQNVSIFHACTAISENANEASYINNVIGYVKNTGPSCSAVLVGYETTGAATIGPHFIGNVIFGDPDVTTNGGKAGMEVQDAGGLWAELNDILYFQTGTLLATRTGGQGITWGFWNNTVLGDTDNVNDLAIRPGVQSSFIWGIQFSNSWSANATTGAPIVLDNTVGADVSGVRFVGHRAYTHGTAAGPNPLDVVDIIPGTVAGFDGLSFAASVLCSQYASSGTGIKVSTNNFTDLSITDTRIGQCDHGAAAATMSVGVQLPTGTVNGQLITLTGNSFVGVATPLLWTPSGEHAVIAHNIGLDGFAAAPVTAAATMTLPLNEFVSISGSTPIATMNNFWGIRRVQLQANTALNFTSGGNICPNQPTTFPIGALITASWASCWYLH